MMQYSNPFTSRAIFTWITHF